MSGALQKLMRSDAQKIVSSGGFQTDILFTDLSGNTETVKGAATLHSTIFDAETGLPAKGKNGHVTVYGGDFKTLDIYGNEKDINEIAMANWSISFEWIDGKRWKFKAEQVTPSYSFDLVTIELGDAK